MSQELAPTTHLDLERAHADGFSEEMRSIIRNAINPNASEADFTLLLEFAGRYKLNPLNGELYLAKMPGQDGSPPRFTPIVGRAGYLGVAQRQKGYRGLRSDVVRAFDTFAVSWDETEPDGTTPKIIHRYDMTFKPEPSDDTGDRPDDANESAEQRTTRKRGKIVGAWCKVYRENNVPTFFYAAWNEYVPRDISKSRFWKSHPSEAIRKCAVSNAVREAFSLSGLYDEAEMARTLEEGMPTPIPDEPEYGDDELGLRIEHLVGEAINVGLQYRPAKVRTILHGADDEAREAFADKLEREVAAARGEKVEDAVVVEDEPEPTEAPQQTL